MVFAITGLYLIILIAGARSFSRQEGYYSTFVVFGVTAFIYYMLMPIELSLAGEERIYIAGRWQSVPSTMQWQISPRQRSSERTTRWRLRSP